MGYKRFKGTPSQYRTLHLWVERQLGKPAECENCGMTTAQRFEWANLSGDYLRDVSDWARLCHVCHTLFDGNDFRFGTGVGHSTACRHGHDLKVVGIYMRPTGHPECRECKRIIKKRATEKAKLGQVAPKENQ